MDRFISKGFTLAFCYAEWFEALGRLHELNLIFPFRIKDESIRRKVDFGHQRRTEIQIKRQIFISIG